MTNSQKRRLALTRHQLIRLLLTRRLRVAGQKKPTMDGDSSYHPIFQPDTLANIAESIGVQNLPKDLLLLLCEDVTYRLRDVIFRSRQLARHSKREQLLVSDVCNVLTNCGFGPVLPVTDVCEDESEDIDLLSQADELVRSNNQMSLSLPTVTLSTFTTQLVDLTVSSTTSSLPTVSTNANRVPSSSSEASEATTLLTVKVEGGADAAASEGT